MKGIMGRQYAGITATMDLALFMAIWNIIDHTEGEAPRGSDVSEAKFITSIVILFVILLAGMGGVYGSTGNTMVLGYSYSLMALAGMFIAGWNWYEHNNPPSQKEKDAKYIASWIVAGLVALTWLGSLGYLGNM